MDSINEQCRLLFSGKYQESREMIYRMHKDTPDNSDISFNAGWAKLSEGCVSEGYKLLDQGRNQGIQGQVWGDPEELSTPIWNGEKATVLLRLERGIGDQFHQVRYARDLKAKGCTVIVSCSAPLAEVIRRADGVDVVVQHEAAGGVLHDFHLPAMSSPIQLGYKTNADINGQSYIKKPDVDTVRSRVGLRWQGNIAYEHSTKRLFPADLLFDAVKGDDFISLQRDEGSELRPKWVESVNLDTWVDTAKAIASCELVITSCTAIAHLAGAMGVPTKTIIPMVPYYLWTFPGNATPYYDSMTLFRQTKPDNWNAPFEELFRAA
jgi:hypothetical protein